MLYSFKVTASANITEDSPNVTYEKLVVGEIKKIIIQIPAGHNGYAHLKIYDGEVQIYPANPQGNISGDDVVIPIEEEYLLEKPNELKFVCWNEDTIRDHSFYISMNIKARSDKGKETKETINQIQCCNELPEWRKLLNAFFG